jgi:hypothetical protein
MGFIIRKIRLSPKNHKRDIIIGTASIIVILFLGLFAGWQWKVAVERTKEANARRLAVIAETVEKDDPTVALRIAEKAWRLDPNPAVNETI